MHEYRASSPRARKCLSLGGCSGTRREGILLALFFCVAPFIDVPMLVNNQDGFEPMRISSETLILFNACFWIVEEVFEIQVIHQNNSDYCSQSREVPTPLQCAL